ncbi:uncharacterized protein DUF4288 [Prosthecobacter fusiformis]|uniref:Uncharacterized protein DUF4288 n=1 Tax=Prosthecobacter fusiformis TaxID=48464 RepID=A0A4R7SR08_9BACT|nr:DUF4288 domain-containing protein [Prosthecobacter fusiformis]TDU81364.1 uncharacterized protein DUF4288 [Prosthecobacter fusiformis]
MLYSAHVVMQVVYTDGVQEDFPVWENIVLVEAENPEEAEKIAREFGTGSEETCDDSFTWNGKKARWVFAGIRRLVTCVNILDHTNVDTATRVGHGTEVTYFEFTMKSPSDFNAYLTGNEVELKMTE